MKLLLINQPANSHINSILSVSAPQLGYAYLDSMVEVQHEVENMDCPTVNIGFKRLDSHLIRTKPDLIGVTSVAFKRLIENGPDLSRVPNIIYRLENEVWENLGKGFIDDLDQLPYPAHHLLPPESYQLEGRRFGEMMTSRGCPY